MRAKGLTQAKIAEALGVTERTVRNWIRGTGK
ncbi:helix-turn-helix domain-containing protein [Thiolapillus sp.]